jgi:tetratricopeptide (TPR) repeat protein
MGADPRSDLFALGVVLYQALTGRHPFLGDTFASTIGRILKEPHTPPGELNARIPVELERVVDKLLAKDAEERHATASDLLVDLRRIRNQFTPRSIPAMPRGRGAALPWRHQIAYGVVAVVFFAILLLAVPGTREPITDWIRPPSLPPVRFVAVEPFSVAGGDAEHAALAAGLSESLLASLSRLGAQHTELVADRAPSAALTGASLLETAAQETGANLLLRGPVEFHDRVYRVPLRIEGPDGLVLERIVEAPRDDVFVVEENLLAAVLDALEVDWTESERRNLLLSYDTTDPAARAFLLRGKGYLARRDDRASIELAVVQFESALRYDPSAAAAHAGLGMARWTLHQLGDETQEPEQAAAHCRAALQVDDALAAANLCLGDIYRGAGRLDEALDQYERAHLLEPTSDRALVALGKIYADLGRFDQAERLLQNATDRRPNDWRSYFDLGWMYAEDLGRHADAVEMFEQARELAPRLTLAYEGLGAEYAQMSRWKDAIRTLEAGLEIRGSNAFAHNNLATAYFNLRNWPAAAEHFRRAIELGYQSSVIWGNLGDARYFSPGERSTAAAAYERALELAREEPSDGQRSAKIAVWHAMLGHADEAKRLMREAVDAEGHNPDVLIKAARVCDQLDEPERALDWAAQALHAGYDIEKLRNDPVFDGLRQHPQFEKILASR